MSRNLNDSTLIILSKNSLITGVTKNGKEETDPVIETDWPYRDGTGYLPICYLDQDCVFINAGLGYIEETPLIGMTTDVNGTPDCNKTDIGFHYPNWNYSNEPNIIPTISGDPNTGWVNVGITGFAPDTQQVFVLADGEYIGEMFFFESGETLNMDISCLGPGTHQLKAVSISDTGRVTCSNLKDNTFNCFLNYCFCADAYDSNEPHYFCAYYPGAENVSVKVYNEDNSLVWSQTYTGQNLNCFIPAEVTLSDDLDYIVFEETFAGGGSSGEASVTRPLGMSFNPDKVPANVRALLVLPYFWVNLVNNVDNVVKQAFKTHGVPYYKLKGSNATFKNFKWFAQNRPIEYLYYAGHGGYGVDPDTDEEYFGEGIRRTVIGLSNGRAVSAKHSNFPHGTAPSWCVPLQGGYERTCYSIYNMGFPPGQLKFVQFDCCFTGRLRLTSSDELVESPETIYGMLAGPESDMSWALGMTGGIDGQFYQGWWDKAAVVWGQTIYEVFGVKEWTELKEGENLYQAVYDTFDDPSVHIDAKREFRMYGMGYITAVKIE